ncbi:putative transporter small subunit [Brevundimonas sp.]|nr:putative transporter small subunit [Brevundimonas sp.]
MNTLWLTTYVLVWPVIVAGVLLFIARAFFKEWKEARQEGRALI